MCAYSVFNTFPVYPLSAKPLILLAFCRYRYHTSLLFDPALMSKCAELGKAVAESLGKPYDEVDTWVGEEGVCPVCHNPLLSMNGTTHVECPICGIWGDLKVDGEKVKVEWSEKEIARARNTNIGIYEHYNEIQNMIKVCVPKLVANKDTLPKMMEKYVNFEETIANM